MSSAGAVGVDFGGGTVKIGVAKRGGVEVITNEASNRESQVVVGFGPEERFIGEQGYVQLKSNFKNTVVFPHRFLGIRSDAPFFAEEKKWLYNNITLDENNKPIFEVTLRKEKKTFNSEQLTAMMLQKIKSIVAKNDLSSKDGIVLSVPNYYIEQERKALLDAARIADVKVLKLLNESTAIAMGYGIFRKTELTATARNVLFIDFGHCSTSAFVGSFTNTKTKIIHQISERNLGVRDIDWKLLEFYSKICVDQYDVNPMKNHKSRLRLIDAIEKQRKILSANSEAAINVDYIAEDNDLSYTLNREKLEELAAPIVEKFRTVLEVIKAELKAPLHSIEIVGGGTRIPIIQKAIQEIFGLEISRTLNASEAIARGCAIQSAMLSPLFKVAQYDIEEANYYPIRCSWVFKDNANIDIESDPKNVPEKQTAILFDKGTSVPSIKSITFHRDEFIDFKLFYDPLPPGADALLSQFIIHPGKPKETEFGVKLRVQLNKNGIIEFDSAQLIEEYTEEIAPAPTTKMAEEGKEGEAQAQPPAQTQSKAKKTRTTKLNVDLSTFNSLNDKQISDFFDQEVQMNNADVLTHETYHKKNELEAYIYDLRGKLGEKYTDYAQPAQKAQILQDLEKAESWLYDEGSSTTKQVYSQKLDELRKHGDPIHSRFREYENVPETLSDFNKNLGTYESVANSTDPNFEHITAEERKPLIDAINEHKTWINSTLGAHSKASRLQNPPVSSNDVLNKHKAFVDKYYGVINKPKPKPQPKAEPAPTQDAQANAGANPEGGANQEAGAQANSSPEKKGMDIEK